MCRVEGREGKRRRERGMGDATGFVEAPGAGRDGVKMFDLFGGEVIVDCLGD